MNDGIILSLRSELKTHKRVMSQLILVKTEFFSPVVDYAESDGSSSHFSLPRAKGLNAPHSFSLHTLLFISQAGGAGGAHVNGRFPGCVSQKLDGRGSCSALRIQAAAERRPIDTRAISVVSGLLYCLMRRPKWL